MSATDRNEVSEHFVEVLADDRLVLPGAHLRAADAAGTAVVWIHGFGVTYDFGPCIAVGRALAGSGLGFVSGAVRGNHAAVAGWRRGERTEIIRIGSWYEVFEESAQDIAAWVDFARACGYGRVVLVGHSLGALKVLQYVADGGQVDGIVLASPGLGTRHVTEETTELARGLVEAGDGESLLPPGSWPRGFGTDTISAQTYLSWARMAPRVFGSDTPWAAAVTCPVLAWYGERGDAGGLADLEELTAGMSEAPSVEVALLPTVRHDFIDGVTEIRDTLLAWLERIGPTPTPTSTPERKA